MKVITGVAGNPAEGYHVVGDIVGTTIRQFKPEDSAMDVAIEMVTSHVGGARQQLLLAAWKVVIGGAQRCLGQLGHLTNAGGIETHARQHLCRSINHALWRIRGTRAHGGLLAKTVVID